MSKSLLAVLTASLLFFLLFTGWYMQQKEQLHTASDLEASISSEFNAAVKGRSTQGDLNALAKDTKLSETLQKHEKMLVTLVDTVTALQSQLLHLESGGYKRVEKPKLSAEDVAEKQQQLVRTYVQERESEPVDVMWQQQTEIELMSNFNDKIHTIEVTGLELTDVECFSSSCRLNVQANRPEDLDHILTLLPWDAEAEFIALEGSPNQGVYYVKQIEPLIPYNAR